MALTVRAGSDDISAALVAGYNALRESVGKATGVATFHRDVTSTTSGAGSSLAATAYTITAANGDGTLATLLLLCADIKKKLEVHAADTVAHLAADTANFPLPALPTDLTTSETWLASVTTSWNAHLSQAGVHVTSDTTNTVATTSLTSQATCDTRATAIKAAYNAHIASAPKGSSIVINPA